MGLHVLCQPVIQQTHFLVIKIIVEQEMNILLFLNTAKHTMQ